MDSFEDNLIEIIRNYPAIYRGKDKKQKSVLARGHCWLEIAKTLNRTPDECKNRWRNIRDNYKKNLNKKKIGVACVSKYDDERLKFIDEYYDASLTCNVDSVDETRDHEEQIPITLLPSTSSAETAPVDPIASKNKRKTTAACNPATPRNKRKIALGDDVRKTRANRNKKAISPSISENSQIANTVDNMLNEPPQGHTALHLLNETSHKATHTPVHAFFSSMADIVCQFPAEKVAETRVQVCNIVTEMELSVLAQRNTEHTYNMLPNTISAYDSMVQRDTPSPQRVRTPSPQNSDSSSAHSKSSLQ